MKLNDKRKDMCFYFAECLYFRIQRIKKQASDLFQLSVYFCVRS